MSKGDLMTLATTADPKPDAAPPLFVARFVRGPNDGKTMVLDWNQHPQVLVGQSKVCEVSVADPRISRRHLALTPEGNAVRLVDLQSTNGTRIGGARVIEALLTGGEVVEIGDSAFRLVVAGELPEGAPPRESFGRVVGKSQAMVRLFARCDALAASPLPIILEGESGTGKELLAEAIHEASPRATRPFVVFDCASGHSEAEQFAALFGSAEGAGALENAIGGTLVLDQVGDLSPQAQLRLVSILDRGEIRRTPTAAPVRTDVRFITTSRDDLDRAVQERSFREELLFRLAGARLELPPLRQRHGDVELLARHFWRLYDKGSPSRGEPPKRLLLQLARHDFRGNVRELQHAISRGAVFDDDDAIVLAPSTTAESQTVSTGRDFLEHVMAMGLAMPRARQLVIREFERRFVARAVKEHGGNVSRAAAASGLTRRYFHMLLAKNADADH